MYIHLVTKYIPYYYEPDDTSSVWFARMMVCSCPRGQASGIPRYFDRYEKLQFEEEKKEYPFMDQHQIISYIMNKRNKEINKNR